MCMSPKFPASVDAAGLGTALSSVVAEGIAQTGAG